MATAPLIQVDHLTLRIGAANQPSFQIEDLNFRVPAGECVALVGESGSGKTLLALALLGLLPANARICSGRILFHGQPVAATGELTFQQLRGRHIAMIFQDAHAALNPAFTIGTQMTDILQTHFELSADAARAKAQHWLQAAGLAGRHLNAYPHELSGGMAQRAMIAMALSCEAGLIIADEPTSALDVTTQAAILNLIRRLQEQLRFGLLLISHDIHVVRALANFILILNKGRVVEKGPAGDIVTRPTHAYTRTLLASEFSLTNEKWQHENASSL